MKRLIQLSFLILIVSFSFGVTESTASQGPAFFQLHHDSIPNFSQNHTIQSAQNGAWASTSTWNPARLPQDGDVNHQQNVTDGGLQARPM